MRLSDPIDSTSTAKPMGGVGDIMPFSAPEFSMKIKPMSQSKTIGLDFEMAEPAKQALGLRKQEQDQVRADLEEKILVELGKVQEKAYKESYSLGMEEGKKSAFEKYEIEIQKSLNAFLEITQQLQNLKLDLLTQNESTFVELIFNMAKRLAVFEFSITDLQLKELSKKVITEMASEDRLTLFVSEAKYEPIKEYITNLQKQPSSALDTSRTQFEIKVDPQMDDFGVRVKSNYGEIDAQLDARVKKLWEEVSDLMPNRKENLSA
jgi:flagellar biosynthesis/type III secretory pathway protein FliH